MPSEKLEERGRKTYRSLSLMKFQRDKKAGVYNLSLEDYMRYFDGLCKVSDGAVKPVPESDHGKYTMEPLKEVPSSLE